MNAYHSKDLQEEINNNHDIESIVYNVRKRRGSIINPKEANNKPSNNNLAINSSGYNKGGNFDRIRRQSEYSPFARKLNIEDNFNDNRRKVSADFTSEKFKFNLTGSGYFNERRMNKYKSQKSFDDNNSHSNSHKKEKERNKDKERDKEREKEKAELER